MTRVLILVVLLACGRSENRTPTETAAPVPPQVAAADASVDAAGEDVAERLLLAALDLHAAGKSDEAAASVEKARAIYEATFTGPQLAKAIEQIGHAYVTIDRPADAIAQFRRVLALAESGLGKDDERLVPVLLAIGQLELPRDPAAASVEIDRAVAIGEKHGGPPDLLAEATYMQAQIAFARGDKKRAHERASKAAAMFTVLEVQAKALVGGRAADIREWAKTVCKC